MFAAGLRVRNDNADEQVMQEETQSSHAVTMHDPE
jgi:hypothetical protein